MIGLLACAASVVAVGSVHADDSMQLQVGKKQYMKYCATCHGPSGTGTDGAASRLFTKPPTNLTLLAKNNGGKFPMMEVIGIVKGDQPIAAHGTREMPVWGDIIGGDPTQEGMYAKDEADAKIMTIGKYLESIQAK
ncbi:c-type cytochrome [Candidatus Binatia bacterium]|jgi:mono/diheme cytochrome c family protein|nr:c-type cytochrome [Candidatus Binatia bacterium]